MAAPAIPDQFPLLCVGKHRNPRKGACFMELASYLAGERWSDRPGCTHPLLAKLARNVNDLTSDVNRQQLAMLVPSVIGLTSDDLHVDARIALRCARTALPLPTDRQRALAVGILACERILTSLDDRPPGSIDEASQTALDKAPDAREWALRFTDGAKIGRTGFRRRAAPTIVTNATLAIATAGLAQSDEMLRVLLQGAVQESEMLIDQHAARIPEHTRSGYGRNPNR